LPLGTASDGATYPLPCSREYAIKPAAPINSNAQPSLFMFITALLS
jgi:hypothetical protein